MNNEFQAIIKRFSLSSLALIGSRAREDHYKYSDIDLIGQAEQTGFSRFSKNKLVVELHIFRCTSEWQMKPSWWYSLKDMKIIFDDGHISKLPQQADLWLKNYQPAIEDLKRNKDWLKTVVRKLKGSNSNLKSSFLITTSTWEILSGLFLARRLPVPANSDMYRHAPSLIGEKTFNELISGEMETRFKTTLKLCNQVIEMHEKTLEQANYVS